MDNCKYPQIIPNRKNGNETVIGMKNSKLLEFWQWAYSDIMNNAERGIFAEWLIAKALDCAENVRKEWDNYDIITSEGIRIEVKTSGYLQSWGQNELSKINFSVRTTREWDSEKNIYSNEQERHSDIYIFCIHKHIEQETVNPLDITQWEFYIIDTNSINKCVGSQKSITLSKLIKIGAILTEYNSLKDAINNLYKNIKQ